MKYILLITSLFSFAATAGTGSLTDSPRSIIINSENISDDNITTESLDKLISEKVIELSEDGTLVINYEKLTNLGYKIRIK